MHLEFILCFVDESTSQTLALVDFETINGAKGQLLSKENQSHVSEYLECLHNVGEQFQYPCFYNGLLLHFFLFNAESQMCQLEEPARIRSISHMTTQVIQYGGEFSHFSKGVDCLQQLVSSLNKMRRFVHTRNAKEKILAMQSLSFDDNRSSEMIGIFHKVFEQISPDYDFIHRQMRSLKGDQSVFPNLHFEASRLFHSRFSSILDNLTGFKVLWTDRVRIQASYSHAISIQLIKFSTCSTLEEQIQLTVGKSKLVPLKLKGRAPVKLGSIFTFDHGFDQSVLDRLGSLIRHDEIYVLVILFVLLDQHTNNASIEMLYKTIYRALTRKILELSPASMDHPQTALGGFIRDIQRFRNMLAAYV